MDKKLYRAVAAEFLGTFVVIIFGVASVAQAILSDEKNALAINLSWGLAVAMGVYVAGGISGAHLNPAVSLALAVHRRFPWKHLLPYITAQMLGAFAAAAVVYGTYYEALNAFDMGTRRIVGEYATAGIWATYPQHFLSTFPGGFVDQVVGTALLVLLIFALTDSRNTAPSNRFSPLLVGASVTLIGMTFGFNAGYAINPARDFAPRLFTAIAGWGSGVFTAANHWWWVPVVAPCIGGCFGGWIYEQFVAKYHTSETELLADEEN